MRKVLLIAYYFPPQGGSGVQRSIKFAKYLPLYGYEPHVITPTCDGSTRTAQLDESLLRELSSVTVHRVSGGEAHLRRLTRYGLQPLIEFFLRPDAVRIWNLRVMQVVDKLVQKHDFQLVYVSLEPWSSALLGVRLKKKYGIRLVLDFRDPWTQRTMKVWPSRFHYGYDRLLERKVVGEADAIIAATPGVARVIQQSHPGISHKVSVIYNGFDSEDIPAQSQPSVAMSPKLRIAYAGTLESWNTQRTLRRRIKETLGYKICSVDLSTHSPLYLLQAVKALSCEQPEFKCKLQLSFAGRFGAANEQLVMQLGLSDVVRVLGYLPHTETIELLQQADVLFLPMLTECDGRRSYNASGKIFEYLALRRPILAAVPEGDAADIVRHARAGWVVNPHDVLQMKVILKDLIARKQEDRLHMSPDEEYIQQFERKSLTGELAQLFDNLLGCGNSQTHHKFA